jgi:hypothetical protein
MKRATEFVDGILCGGALRLTPSSPVNGPSHSGAAASVQIGSLNFSMAYARAVLIIGAGRRVRLADARVPQWLLGYADSDGLSRATSRHRSETFSPLSRKRT